MATILLEGSKKRPTVNMNVDLRKGGRNAVKMSIEDFKKEMEHTYKEYMMEKDKDVSFSSYKRIGVGNFIYHCCYKNKQNEKNSIMTPLYKDVWECKYKFDSENCDNVGDIKMSKKGFPYIEVSVGGDWESPVCFFVYYDGSKFRGYVPLKGNAINRNLKQAFGNNDEEDENFIRSELGLSKNEEFPFDNHDVNYNINACLEDFLSRVTVNGSYKKHDYTKDDEKYENFKKKKEEEKEQRDLEREKNKEELLSDNKLNEIIDKAIKKTLKYYI